MPAPVWLADLSAAIALRRVDDRIFLRFVPADGGEVVRNTLSCLRTVTCKEIPPGTCRRNWPTRPTRHGAKREGISSRSGCSRPTPQTSNQGFAPFPQSGRTPSEIPARRCSADGPDLLVESIEPRGAYGTSGLKDVFDPEADEPHAASAKLVDKVRELGLQPFVQPNPLPPIELDDVTLICWMAVDSEPPAVDLMPAKF